MFSGTPNPLPLAPTPYDSGKTIMYKPEVLITHKRKQISTRSQALLQCFGAFQVRLRSNRRRPTSESSVMCKLPVLGAVSTSAFYLMLFSKVWYCRHPWKWSGVPYKTLPQPPRSPWYRFLSQSYNNFRHESAILIFWVKEASGEVGIYTTKRHGLKLGIATEIALISVSVVKLLVLPVWGIVSTFDSNMTLFSEVGQCWYWWKWIGRALKHCRWDHFDIVVCHKFITTSGIRPPSWNSGKEVSDPKSQFRVHDIVYRRISRKRCIRSTLLLLG